MNTAKLVNLFLTLNTMLQEVLIFCNCRLPATGFMPTVIPHGSDRAKEMVLLGSFGASRIHYCIPP